MSVKSLGLSVRTSNSLQKNKIFNLNDLAECPKDLLKKFLGREGFKSVQELLFHPDLQKILEDDQKAKASSFKNFHDWVLLKKKQKFAVGNNELILDLWNSDNGYTLEEVGSEVNLTRERVRQILSQAKNLGLKVNSSKKNRKLKREKIIDKNYKRYSKIIIDWYEQFSVPKIAKKLNIPIQTVEELEEKLIKEGNLKKIFLRQRLETKLSDNVKRERWNKIIELRQKGLSLDEVASQMLLSTPTISNTIREMKNNGMEVPNSRPDHQYENVRLSEAERIARILFIKEKTKNGWSRKKVGEALGLDSSAISRIISANIEEFNK